MSNRRSLAVSIEGITKEDEQIMRQFVTQKPGGMEEPRQIPRLESPRRNSRTGLIPITVRLSPELANRLKLLSVHRELEGYDFYTQQDIVGKALDEWISKNNGAIDK